MEFLNMAIKTQGTDLYTIDPDTNELLDVGCITSITGIDTSIDQIETTCLNYTSRTYEAGLATPGTATFSIYIDPKNPVHVRLLELKNRGAQMQWAIGWSESPQTAPSVTVDGEGVATFDLPPARSWLVFEGYMNAFPLTFDQNTMVTSEIGIQVSGDPVLIPAGGQTT